MILVKQLLLTQRSVWLKQIVLIHLQKQIWLEKEMIYYFVQICLLFTTRVVSSDKVFGQLGSIVAEIGPQS